MNVSSGRLPTTNRGHSPVCGRSWLIVGGVIVALSVFSPNEVSLREALVYGAQGLMISLYGWYRLRLARPPSVHTGSRVTRSLRLTPDGWTQRLPGPTARPAIRSAARRIPRRA